MFGLIRNVPSIIRVSIKSYRLARAYTIVLNSANEQQTEMLTEMFENDFGRLIDDSLNTMK